MILPQMEQSSLYNAINFAVTVVDYNNNTTNLVRAATFICPADASSPTFLVLDQNGKAAVVPQWMPLSNYLGVFGTGASHEVPEASDGIFGRNSNVSLRDIRDGTGQTLAIYERCSELN